VVVVGDPLVDQEAVRDGALPGDVTGGLGSKVLLHLQRKTAVWFIGLDGDGVGSGVTSQRAKWRHKCRNRATSERESERERREWR
jgi:hypothetical protein